MDVGRVQGCCRLSGLISNESCSYLRFTQLFIDPLCTLLRSPGRTECSRAEVPRFIFLAGVQIDPHPMQVSGKRGLKSLWKTPPRTPYPLPEKRPEKKYGALGSVESGFPGGGLGQCTAIQSLSNWPTPSWRGSRPSQQLIGSCVPRTSGVVPGRP